MGNCCHSEDTQGSDLINKSSYLNLDEIHHIKGPEEGLCCKLSHCKLQHCRLLHACSRAISMSPGSEPSGSDEFKVPWESLQLLGQLEKGHFEGANDYFKGALNVTIKRITTDIVSMKDLHQDIEVMKAVSHANIVRLHATCTQKNLTCILMEYMCNGNLYNYMRGEHGGHLKPTTKLNIATQIADGMKYLESHYLIHKCLSSKNILVGYGDVVKLANFSFIKMTADGTYKTSGEKFMIQWTAPEVLRKQLITIKSNVWSFGIVLYEVFTQGEEPYKGLEEEEIYRLVTEESYRMPKPTNLECYEVVYEVMLSCWKSDPDSRPTFDFLHHYFEFYEITSEPICR